MSSSLRIARNRSGSRAFRKVPWWCWGVWDVSVPGPVCGGPGTVGGWVGGVRVSHTRGGAVPWALEGLASGFGMDAGRVPLRCGHRPKHGGDACPACVGWAVFCLWCWLVVGSWWRASLCADRGPWCGRCVGFVVRPVSTRPLNTLLCVHVGPIDPVICWGPYPTSVGGDVILGWASRLDAFSGYPCRTWPTSHAPGGTTGALEVRPSRSSRTGDSSPHVSTRARRIGTELSHDVLNPARVPL